MNSAPVSGPGRVRLDSLTGLRWWAAFGVFIYHMKIFAPVPGLSALAPYGNYGVAFFFILSGFVLTYSAHGRATTARNFYWRRFARIYPAHIVALLLAIPVFYSFTPAAEDWWVKPVSVGVLLLSVVLLQGWSRDPAILFSGNPAAWTLTVEAFFYVLHPWVNRVVGRLRGRGATVLVFGALAVSFAYWIALALSPDSWLASVPLPITRLSEFVIGMGIAQLVLSGVRVRIAPLATYGLLAAFVLWRVLGERQGWNDPVTGWSRSLTEPILIALCALIILAVAARDMRGGFSLQNRPVLVRLGAWSFAFYLVHATVMYSFMAVFGAQPGSLSNLLWYPPVFAIALLLAWALYRFVEHPLERKMRLWGDKRLAG